VFGTAFVRNYYTIFDMETSRIGISPHLQSKAQLDNDDTQAPTKTPGGRGSGSGTSSGSFLGIKMWGIVWDIIIFLLIVVLICCCIKCCCDDDWYCYYAPYLQQGNPKSEKKGKKLYIKGESDEKSI
jgi:hypothetical protein